MVLALLSAQSTQAAPQVFKGVAAGVQVRLAALTDFDGLGNRLKTLLAGEQAPSPKSQEKQAQRAARVARIQISPGEVTLRVGEQVTFAAVALDARERPVGGVKFKWSAADIGDGRVKSISRNGEFKAVKPGEYKVGVEGAKRSAEVLVRVLDGPRRREGARPTSTRSISSRAQLPPPRTAVKNERRRDGERRQRLPGAVFAKTAYDPSRPSPAKASPAAAAVRLLPEGWNDDNFPASDDPGNQVGDPPGSSPDSGAGSGNFKIAAPLLNLIGRRTDVTLSLNYNSRVWTKANWEITFDADRGWPAPGWSLGFGKILGLGPSSGSILVDADGTRHAFGGKVTTYNYPWATWSNFEGHTTDGTFADYWHTASADGSISSAYARLASGTVINYGAWGGGAVHPTHITDSNGNQITITYRNNQGPNIETVTDTLGRVVRFHYDSGGLLTAITAPGLNDGPPRTLVRLQYQPHTLDYGANYGFSTAMTPRVRAAAFPVVRAIYLPGTGTGYWFGGADSYSSYGMIAKVDEQRAMSFAGPEPSMTGPTEQGVISPGSNSRLNAYAYPLQSDTTLTDAPTFPTVTETWDGMAAGESAITRYDALPNASPRLLEVTWPDGTRSIQKSHNASNLAETNPEKYKDGLVFEEETRAADGTPLKSSHTEWMRGAYESPRPRWNSITDHEIGRTRGVEYTYGAHYNQIEELREYDYGYQPGGGSNTLLRRKRTVYENSAPYTNNHIFSLVKEAEIYAGDGTRMTRVLYEYDGDGADLGDTPEVVQHSERYNPHAPVTIIYPECYEQCGDPYEPCQWICPDPYPSTEYDPATDYRGNLTKTTSYADASSSSPSNFSIQTSSYDIDGNAIKSSSSCCDLATSTYTLATQYAYPTSRTSGSASSAASQMTTNQSFDFNTGLLISTTDPNGLAAETRYQPASLRVSEAITSTGARAVYEYDDAAMTFTESALSGAGGAVGARKVKFFDGAGRVRREEATAVGGGTDVVETLYDTSGRVKQQSSPYRAGSGQPVWSHNTYDGLDRVTVQAEPDGSATKAFYNDLDPSHPRPDAASAEPGQTTLIADPWGRERWERLNVLGLVVEVVEPDPNGGGTVAGGGMRTSYSYDSFGKLAEVVQGSQRRSFRYDSFGRLTHQKLAEAEATLNDAGQYVGQGGLWSDVYTYDANSKMTSHTDARGVKTLYSYDSAPGQADPLHRLHALTYDTSGVPADQRARIVNAPPVTYEYMPGGDKLRLKKVTAVGVSTEEYGYDAQGRVNKTTLTFAARPSFPLVTEFGYDVFGRVTDVTYPAQYTPGVTAPARKTVHHDYDAASRISALRVDGALYASGIVYNASEQVTQVKVGPAGNSQVTEGYQFNPVSGLLESQTTTRNGNTLLDLSYEYLRPGTTSGRTGQITKITNNLHTQRGRTFTYDALGRLTRAAGGNPGATPSWTQDYVYDRYGNRTGVAASGVTLGNFVAPSEPSATLPSVEVAANVEPKVPEFMREGARADAHDGPPNPRLYGAVPGKISPALIAAPTGASVTTVSASTVALTWTAPAGAVDHYEVERSQSLTGPYTLVASPATNSVNDNTVSAGTAYLYRVRAVEASGLRSSPSNIALATAVTFADTPLVAGVNVVREQHLTQLRQAVNSVRRAANLADASWAEAVSAGSPIRAAHVQELRDRLNEALSALSIYTSGYTDPVLTAGTTFVKKVHFEELRSRASRGSSSSSGTTAAPVPRDGLASLSYDPATNRINSPGWGYDAAGNQTRAQIADGTWQRMEYDAANRLAKVTADDGTVLASHLFGPTNLRLMTQQGGTRTYYVWAQAGVLAEFSETNGTASAASPQWTRNNIYLGERLLATQQPVTAGEYVEYHHPDNLGTRVVTNSVNALVQEQANLPFGTELPGESMGGTNRRFTGYERSAQTGLDYAVNRFYDARQGRFTQVDPLGIKASSLENPQTLNLYSYCANDPVNRIDPDGLFWGAIKRFFKKLWNGLKAVLRAIIAVVRVILAVVQINISNQDCNRTQFSIGGGGVCVRFSVGFNPNNLLCKNTAIVPEDPDGKAVVQTILGESTSHELIGKKEYATSQGGERAYENHRNATGPTITRTRLYEEKLALAALIFNRLRDGRFGSSLRDVVTRSRQFAGYALGAIRLPLFQNTLIYSKQCDWLFDVIDAYNDTKAGRRWDTEILFNVRVIQNQKVRIYTPATRFRKGDSDFSTREF